MICETHPGLSTREWSRVFIVVSALASKFKRSVTNPQGFMRVFVLEMTRREWLHGKPAQYEHHQAAIIERYERAVRLVTQTS